MNYQNAQAYYRPKYEAELARLLNCTPEEIPVSAPKDVAASFLGISKKTFNVWNSTKRHGIVMVRVGRKTEPTCDWLIDMKLKGLMVAQEVA